MQQAKKNKKKSHFYQEYAISYQGIMREEYIRFLPEEMHEGNFDSDGLGWRRASECLLKCLRAKSPLQLPASKEPSTH